MHAKACTQYLSMFFKSIKSSGWRSIFPSSPQELEVTSQGIPGLGTYTFWNSQGSKVVFGLSTEPVLALLGASLGFFEVLLGAFWLSVGLFGRFDSRDNILG